MTLSAPDIMRARILGTYNCAGCKHFHIMGAGWCHKKQYSPLRNIPLRYQVCNQFDPRPIPVSINLDVKFSDYEAPDGQ